MTTPASVALADDDYFRPRARRHTSGSLLTPFGAAVVRIRSRLRAVPGVRDRSRQRQGQAGIIVGAIVTAAVLAAQRAWFAPTLEAAARTLGLGPPRSAGLLAAAVISVLLLLVVPAFARAAGVVWSIAPDAMSLVPGLFAQAGIAEEVLFRGYLFGHFRRGRSFWRAASLSMVPFVAVHLVLFATMPFPIAMAALLLAVVVSFPMAHLFELGGMTIWPPALLHFVIQGTVKVVAMPGDSPAGFPVAWMAASAALPFLAFLIRRPAVVADE